MIRTNVDIYEYRVDELKDLALFLLKRPDEVGLNSFARADKPEPGSGICYSPSCVGGWAASLQFLPSLGLLWKYSYFDADIKKRKAYVPNNDISVPLPFGTYEIYVAVGDETASGFDVDMFGSTLASTYDIELKAAYPDGELSDIKYAIYRLLRAAGYPRMLSEVCAMELRWPNASPRYEPRFVRIKQKGQNV